MTVSGIVLAVLWLALVAGARTNYFSLLENNLASTDRRTVLDAIESLEEPGSRRAGELLELAAASGDAGIRVRVAQTRGGSRDRYALTGLLQACRDDDFKVRAAAVQALARFPEGIPAMALGEVDHLLEADPDPPVRAAAFQAILAGHSGAESRALAGKWLAHPDPLIRARAVEAVGRTDWDFRPLVIPLLDDPAPLVRVHAARLLRKDSQNIERTDRVLAGVLGDAGAGSDAHEVALATLHGGPPRIGSLPGHILNSADPAVRVLALALRLEWPDGDPSGTLREIFAVLADPAHTERLRDRLLPHVPDFSENVADAILMASASLEPEKREQVAGLLAGWHRVLETRMEDAP